MMHPKNLWNRISIRYKVMTWVIAILLLVATAVGVSIFSLEIMIRDYENLSIDNYKCYEVQKAIDAERSVFQDLIREPDQRNQTRFTKACVKTQLCIASLPTDYSKIGENRYARTWNLRNGYYGYVERRDKLLAMDTSQPDYTTELYKEEDGENLRLSLIRESIRTYIESNYREDISMQSADQTMGYSEAYFCKLFKQCFRVNFSAYLNEYRIEKAKVLMADPRINIKDIGIACGYSDSNYFARVFKRITGQTPSDYRLAAAEKIVKGS